jgi:hypothetical protein
MVEIIYDTIYDTRASALAECLAAALIYERVERYGQRRCPQCGMPLAEKIKFDRENLDMRIVYCCLLCGFCGVPA